VSGGAGTVIFTGTAKAPSTLDGWLPLVSYVVNFQSNTSAASELAVALSSNVGSMFGSGAGSTNLMVGATHAASVSGTFMGGVQVGVNANVTFTLTGYNAGAQANLLQFPDAANVAESNLSVTWLPAI